ncbi:MAG: single-stranded-DNA-specific exonuclease RecJ [Bacteroidota bacterium]
MAKRWVVKDSGDVDTVENLAKELNINPILSNLLVQRGITNFDGAKKFFRPELSQLHDPFLMRDMEKAVSRIEEAIISNEKILVYGDYDVDGATSVALVYSFLKRFYGNVDFYLPCRYAEGYGISIKSIDYAHENGFTLVIALDCGIKANDKIDYANERGIDFIICDHHRPGDVLPNAVAVLDPKRLDAVYPFDELSGCGVGFKLVQGFSMRNNIPFSDLEQYLDLVAISIAADIVPINDENRILAHYGLKRINHQPRPGVKAIMELANAKKELSISDLVFIVGPRINAAGRIENARHAVDLLITKNKEEAFTSGQGIDVLNTERKTLDTNITEHALEMIKDDEINLHRKSTVIFHPEWHKGVIGIVASRLIDKYYRPTIVLTQNDNMITGSARSVKGFDIYNAIDACSDLLEQFGGHKYAAGLMLKPENMTAFSERFEEVVCSTIEDWMMVQEVDVDAEIKLSDISPSLMKILKQFAPFGPGNMSPVFKSSGVYDGGGARIVGRDHLKLNLKQNDREAGFDAIAFQQGIHAPLISKGIPFDICYSIEENEWNGSTTIQLNIKDIKFG